MKCPFCGDLENKVVDSRRSEDGNSIRRRRECLACQRRFTTYEIVESLPIIVIKRDGSRQAFDRNKILNSMVRAFDKRKVEISELERIKPLDEVAYIRFASVYRRFQDVSSFVAEINKLSKR